MYNELTNPLLKKSLDLALEPVSKGKDGIMEADCREEGDSARMPDKTQEKSELQLLLEKINTFRDERDWRQFHNEKDLAISISLEASELLELFQWKSSEDVVADASNRIKEELADVFIYAMMMADNLNLDIKEIIEAKLELNKRKYPVELSKGSNKKYDEL